LITRVTHGRISMPRCLNLRAFEDELSYRRRFNTDPLTPVES
jgi:hypothetical protein